MAIRLIEAENTLVFRGTDHNTEMDKDPKWCCEHKYDGAFQLKPIDGINVLLGENGTGKTTILKMIYAATQESVKRSNQLCPSMYFTSFSDANAVFQNFTGKGSSSFRVSDGKCMCEITLRGRSSVTGDLVEASPEWKTMNLQAIFIPTVEMLSHSKGLLALDRKYYLPFDRTLIDVVMNASLPEVRYIPEYAQKITELIAKEIGGEVIQENDIFYIAKFDGGKIEFSLEAEGCRKLGLLWKLIRNGLLLSGSILLWDEPEANLSPELFPLVADVLLELERNGVQIFLATHSYDFAKYLEIRRENKEEVMFHNLCKDKVYGVTVQSAPTMEELRSAFMEANEKLLDEVYALM